MSRCLLVAELATAHGGDLDLAGDMIRAAADSGADLVKLQSYSLEKLNPKDPQADWLKQSHLDQAAHVRLMHVAACAGIELFSTPFDADSLQMLRWLGLKRFKIASSESGNEWWHRPSTWWEDKWDCEWIVSWPWGNKNMLEYPGRWVHLTAIPLYPTPLECVKQAALLDGYSDHAEGLMACYYALAHGAKMIEAHLCLPGRSREKSFDKSPAQFRQLRDFADQMATISSGVSQTFRERWQHTA